MDSPRSAPPADHETWTEFAEASLVSVGADKRGPLAEAFKDALNEWDATETRRAKGARGVVDGLRSLTAGICGADASAKSWRTAVGELIAVTWEANSAVKYGKSAATIAKLMVDGEFQTARPGAVRREPARNRTRR